LEDITEKWRARARELVASGMPVSQWCEANGVEKSEMRRRLRRFRDEEPELLGGSEAAHAGDGRRQWYEAVRRFNAGGPLPAAGAAAPAFVEVALAPSPAPAPVVVDLRTLTAEVRAGADAGALAALLRAAASL